MSRKSVQRFCDNDMHENKALKLRTAAKKKSRASPAFLLLKEKVLVDRVLEALAGRKLRHGARRNLHFRAGLRVAAGRSSAF
ncbi:hypothetical protein FJ567_11730 [Mesorhizobium sp. B2-4-16]|nr:hypothetical protein FJ567_11730 [Mesorhizobium sp. B2-4-16]TPL71997.1 hypothetical protein FJ956_11955 [Mesorhizobium sp. B2-4-3]